MISELHDLYRVVVWENTAMLALCSSDCNRGASELFGNDLMKSLQKRGEQSTTPTDVTVEPPAAVEMDQTVAEEKTSPLIVNQLKPLISLASR